MNKPINVLLQTTIERTVNDWHIGRFSMLREYLASLKMTDGGQLFRVTARDRDPIGAPDAVLSSLDRSTYDEMWLFAVDTGEGLHDADRAGILRFRSRGGGLMITRDHMDLGCSICSLGAVGAAHLFHTHNIDLAAPRFPPDDRGTPQSIATCATWRCGLREGFDSGIGAADLSLLQFLVGLIVRSAGCGTPSPRTSRAGDVFFFKFCGGYMSKTRSRRVHGAMLASYCIAAAGGAWWSHAALDNPLPLSDVNSDAERAFRRPLLANELPPDAYRRPLLVDVDPGDLPADFNGDGLRTSARWS